MHYSIWNSSTPAAFVKIGAVKKAKYTSNEYMLLVLTSNIAEGATGIAHTACLEIFVNSRIFNLKVIVKLAFHSKQTQHLQHKHTIYMHLAASGVEEGIPHIFGLFEDVETKAIALIMSHKGNCLLQKPVSELSEGAKAKLEPTKKAKKVIEMDYLIDVLKGKDDDPWMSASMPSKSSHHTPSKNWSDDGDCPEDDDETYDNGDNKHGTKGKVMSHNTSAKPDKQDPQRDMFKTSATLSSTHAMHNPEEDKDKPSEEE
ncbi:hypothetical protein H0H87_000489 [Tephrocybe sp. NHM501043]|nr:hypothetical protein H0H87_000489 [Tephrocybe sp. NHM501043]